MKEDGKPDIREGLHASARETSASFDRLRAGSGFAASSELDLPEAQTTASARTLSGGVPGGRARLGLLSPDDGINDDEFWHYLPDGVSLIFTRYRTAAIMEPLETDLGKLVVSAPAVSIWAALRLAGVKAPVFGRGVLLAEH